MQFVLKINALLFVWYVYLYVHLYKINKQITPNYEKRNERFLQKTRSNRRSVFRKKTVGGYLDLGSFADSLKYQT